MGPPRRARAAPGENKTEIARILILICVWKNNPRASRLGVRVFRGVAFFLCVATSSACACFLESLSVSLEKRCARAFRSGRTSVRMRRRSKAANGGLRRATPQLQLPPQRTLTHSLSFSSIERHFYSKQHRLTAKAASHALSLFRRSCV